MECPFVKFTSLTLSVTEDGDGDGGGDGDRDRDDAKRQQPDPKLQEGEFLPQKLAKQLPADFKATPIEEIDKAYSKKETYLMIDRMDIINRFSTQKSVWVFAPFNETRKFVTSLILHRIWVSFMSLVIILNCLKNTMPANEALEALEVLFFLVYMVEMLLKIVAKGFLLHKHSYLRNPWNRLDFAVNFLMALFIVVPDLSNFSMLRTLVASRPLFRLIQIFSYNRKLRYGFRIIAKCLTSIFYPLMITFFTFFFFAIIAANMFTLVPGSVCLSTGNRTQDTQHLPRNPSDRSEWYQSDDRSDHETCSHNNWYPDETYVSCPENYTCATSYILHTLYGTTTDGHWFLGTLVGVLQLMLRDQWDQLFLMMTGTSGILASAVYFMGATFVLCYFCANLIFAAIVLRCEQFDEEYEWPQEETPTAAEDSRPPPDYCRNRVGSLVTHPIFESIITAMIVYSTIAMMSEHHDMEIWFEEVLKMSFMFTNLWFFIELVLKLIAGKQYYFRDNWDRFDFCTLVLTVISAFFRFFVEHVSGLHLIYATTLMPGLRMYRILFFLPSVDILLIGITRKGKKVFYFLFMVLVVLFIFAVFGLQLFGKNYEVNKHLFVRQEIPRLNFLDMIHAFFTTFTTTCGEGVEALLDCALVSGWPCFYHIVPLLILGNLVLIPIAAAILLTTLEKSEEVPRFAFAENIKGLFMRSARSVAVGSNETDADHESIELDMVPVLNQDESTLIANNEVTIVPPIEEGRLAKAMKLPAAEILINVIIVLYVVCLAQTTLAIHYLTFLFFVILFVETILRLVAFGCKAFFADFWCVFSGFVLMAKLIDMLSMEIGMPMLNMDAVPSLFLLRVIRSFCRFKDVKLIVNTFVASLLPLLMAGIVGTVLLNFFAIIGVQLFVGVFFRCVDRETGELLPVDIASNRTACLSLSDNVTWSNPTFNFDNILNSYLSLLQVATFRGWLGIIQVATDTKHYDEQHEAEVNIYMIYYFIVFVFAASFFVLKFCLLVIVDVYRKQRKAVSGNVDMTRAEETFNTLKKKINARFGSDSNVTPKPIDGAVQRIVASNWFEVTSLGLIGLNLILLALFSFSDNEREKDVLYSLSLLLVLVFVFEIVMRVAAIGWRSYVADNLNKVDILFIVLTLIWLISLILLEKTLPLQGMLRMLKFFHLVQLLSHKLPDLCIGLITLRTSIRPLLIVFALLLTVNVIYSVFAITWFSNIKLRTNGITELVNMRTFGNSFLLMFQLSTTSGWDKVLAALGEETDCRIYDYNEPDLPNDCGHFIFALIFIISYVIISYFIIFNISVAIVIDNYRLAYDTLEAGFSDHNLDECLLVWRQYDPTGSGHISVERLTDLVADLKGSFRLDKPNEIKLAALDVDIDPNGVTFKALLDGYLRFYLLKGEKPSISSETTSTKKREDFCAKVIQRSWLKYRKEKETA